MPITESLGYNIYQMPLIDLDSIYRSTGYIIQEEKTILIETGASFSNNVILSSLQELDITPGQVDYIAVTHIHLDHAGGAGLLMQQCPNAKLLVHKKGASHMADPTKLVDGARVVYGDAFDKLFDPVIPVPGERIKVMKDGEILNLGNYRNLEFLDTPGHAFHHFSINDPVSKGFFSGDIAGIFFKQLYEEQGIDFCLPVTAPTQFIPDIMGQTLSRLIDLNPKRIYFTHYGMAENAISLLEYAKKLTAFFGNECVKFYQAERSDGKLFHFIRDRLLTELKKKGVKGDFPEKDALNSDIKMNVQGIIYYAKKLERD